MWLKKRRERSAEEALDAVQPVESLRLAAEEGGLHVPQLRLSIPLGEGGKALHINRHEIWVSDGLRTVRWQVDALRPLYRGNRRPPSDAEMAHYPPSTSCSFTASSTTSCSSASSHANLLMLPNSLRSTRRCGAGRTGRAWGHCTTSSGRVRRWRWGYGRGVRRNTRRYLASYPARRGISKSAPHRVTTSSTYSRRSGAGKHPAPTPVGSGQSALPGGTFPHPPGSQARWGRGVMMFMSCWA